LVRWTHECFDGSGYPDHLRGDALPLGARVIAVCAAFGEQLAGRPGRGPVGTLDALGFIRSGAGTRFDPVCVEALCAVVAARASASWERAVGSQR
jgi:response regulator RpfG family c-di-GMP phosphodiesterase